MHRKWNWKPGEMLGKGAYGCVYLAILDTGGFAAVKQVMHYAKADSVGMIIASSWFNLAACRGNISLCSLGIGGRLCGL